MLSKHRLRWNVLLKASIGPSLTVAEITARMRLQPLPGGHRDGP